MIQNNYCPISEELWTIYNDGTHTSTDYRGILWWYVNANCHRDDDKPAVLSPTKKSASWFQNNSLHRNKNQPAHISQYVLNWYHYGKRHRINGPAVIIFYPKLITYYYVNDVNITQEVELWLNANNYTHNFTDQQIVEFKLRFL
jgi:hypothetical protein